MNPIVLAVYPSTPQALPALERALCGAGRPGGLREARLDPDGSLVLGWDPQAGSIRVLMALIDAELRRYNATRRTELRCELSLDQLSQIAAQELLTPEIAPDRVLEALLAEAGFGSISC